VPLFVGERYLLGEVIVFFIWAMVAMNWNLLMGHAGVFSLAQLLFKLWRVRGPRRPALCPDTTHKSLFLRLTLEKHGEPMYQSLAGGGTLRIDKPRPKVVAKKSSTKKAPAADKKAPKRLSRLEQLRLEQAEKAKAGSE